MPAVPQPDRWKQDPPEQKKAATLCLSMLPPHLYSVICLTNLRTRSSMPCVPATLPPFTMTVVGLGCSTVEEVVVVALEADLERREPWDGRIRGRDRRLHTADVGAIR